MQYQHKKYYKNNQLVKKIWADGSIVYYQNGQVHRDRGPACIDQVSKVRMWYQKGRLHRDHGPAVIGDEGEKQYFRRGRLHRKDGPAVIYPDGTGEYYLNGRFKGFYQP
ncbi:MAG: hypothetical protein LBK60_06515 [Verrucomicrobiales bacterium]|jgi:hypothetical protein|nr:hypothetical protein [Verrucomicrobiales bacterium]